MTEQKTSIVYEEATPFDLSDEDTRALVKSRIKNTAWTMGFCLASDYVGLMQLGELFGVSDRVEDADCHRLSLFFGDEMLVVSLPVPGVLDADVEHYMGEVFGTDETWRYPAMEEDTARIVCASPTEHAPLYRIFFADLLRNAAEVN